MTTTREKLLAIANMADIKFDSYHRGSFYREAFKAVVKATNKNESLNDVKKVYSTIGEAYLRAQRDLNRKLDDLLRFVKDLSEEIDQEAP